MHIEPLVPDAAAPPAPHPFSGDDGSDARAGGGAFGRLVDAAGAILAGADRAESAFVAHRGGLQEMVVERARADIALQVAATAAQRATQALSTVLGMQL
jgi:flagellar hook-basal body complex protein FliE